MVCACQRESDSIVGRHAANEQVNDNIQMNSQITGRYTDTVMEVLSTRLYISTLKNNKSDYSLCCIFKK